MTEQEWRTATGPDPLLEYLRQRVSERKLRLYAIACCRRIWHLVHPIYHEGVELAEGYADGTVGAAELERAYVLARGMFSSLHLRVSLQKGDVAAHVALAAMSRDCISSPESGATLAREALRRKGDTRSWVRRMFGFGPVSAAREALRDALVGESLAQAALVRCIFSNPFSPPVLSPSWLTWKDETIPRMAHTIDADRAFTQLPILADALEDAGCADADILGHCRSGGEHARGCWVIDTLLERQ
jgi:hypothetical protein